MNREKFRRKWENTESRGGHRWSTFTTTTCMNLGKKIRKNERAVESSKKKNLCNFELFMGIVESNFCIILTYQICHHSHTLSHSYTHRQQNEHQIYPNPFNKYFFGIGLGNFFSYPLSMFLRISFPMPLLLSPFVFSSATYTNTHNFRALRSLGLIKAQLSLLFRLRTSSR